MKNKKINLGPEPEIRMKGLKQAAKDKGKNVPIRYHVALDKLKKKSKQKYQKGSFDSIGGPVKL